MKLSASDVAARLSSLPGWRFEENALKRQFEFPSFPDAIAFITRLAFEAEATDHHPDLTVNFRRVTVAWSTHTDDGVTEKDFAGATRSNGIAQAFSASS
jgi:4a-hydroxytetrahydrobiopterin dehydratase